MNNRASAKATSTESAGRRKLLRTGTYLYTRCPVCRADLIEEDWIRFKVISAEGSEGLLELSPRFNVFDKRSSVPLRAGTQMRDLQCPRCHVSLIVPDRMCHACGSPAFRIHIRVANLELGLYICARIGCPWHGISDEDSRRIALESSEF